MQYLMRIPNNNNNKKNLLGIDLTSFIQSVQMCAKLWKAGWQFLRSSEIVGMHGSVLLIAGVFLQQPADLSWTDSSEDVL